MEVININNNFIQTCAKYIFQNKKKCVIIVPEKICISPLKDALALEIHTGAIPKIISIEGLTGDDLGKDLTFASRNIIFAKVFELTSRYIENEQDASTFARAIIGELPNLHAFNITPRKILAEIPATIATQKEINLNLFVKIWEELNSWISQNETIPYYHTQELALAAITQQCLAENTPIYIIYDFGRSQTLQNFIKLLKKSEVQTTIFIQNYEQSEANFQILNNLQITDIQNQNTHSQKKIHIISNTSEESTIANIIREMLTQQSENSSTVPQIGIICEDETLSSKISLELEFSNIIHQHNIATPIESNSLIKAFLAIFEQKPAKLLPILKIPNGEKQQILSAIINKEHNNNTLWNEFLSLFPRKSKIKKEVVIEVFTFIAKNKNKIHTNKTTVPTFLQFKHFCLNEINNFEGSTIEKSIILHIANSWKIWEEKTPSNIKICNLRSVLFQKFDVIILTSAFKIQPTGNVIFSCGMRSYYGFEMPEITGHILQTICNHTIITAENSPLPESQIVKRVLEIQRTSVKKANNNAPLYIAKSQMPRTLSATQVESLFANPLEFHYQYIKGLKEVRYISKFSMEVGNFVHSILEFATKKIIQNNQFNFVHYTKNSFQKDHSGKFKSVEVFFIKPMLGILEDIAKNSATRNISVETQGIQVQINVQNEIFTVTAKPDRIDTITSSIIIYDYKSGSSSSFTKSSIKKFEKIQTIIPAMFLLEINGNSKQFFGNYTFLEHSVKQNITFEITPELIEQFKQKLSKTIELYLHSGAILPIGNDMRSFYHTSRTFLITS